MTGSKEPQYSSYTCTLLWLLEREGKEKQVKLVTFQPPEQGLQKNLIILKFNVYIYISLSLPLLYV